MFKFDKVQQVYSINGVEIGGQPGEKATVLIGSMFFSGHRIVQDPDKGIFDKAQALALLKQEEELSCKYGNPRFIDVIGETSEALIKYIEFVSRNSTAPILLDSPSQKVRIQALEWFAKSEILPRLVYNSIAEDYTDEELACIKECGIKNAIVLAFSMKALKPEAKLKLLQEKLLPLAEEAGIEQILVDTGVLDVPSISWTSLAIKEVKSHLGFPTGCAPANALYRWDKMRANKSLALQASASAIFSLLQSYGANFILYGSLHNAPWVYPAVATTDALIAYGGRFTGVRPTKNHPLYEIF
jgi:tetrahydromethanopterin S-methyltransferase subunit H